MSGEHGRRGTGPVTIVDVAREAGVSYATVSRVVNNEPYVREQTRERVLAAMGRLGYIANRQARSLRGGRSHTVGLLVLDLGTGYIGEIIRGIDAELAAAEYDLLLYTTHRHTAKESAYVTTLTQGLADGLLLVLPQNPAAYLETLRAQSFPYVLIDHRGMDDAAPAVAATNVQGGYDATRYLLSLGHRRIGFITGIMALRCSTDRLAGYQRALAEAGVAPDPTLIVEGDFNQPSGYDAASTLLARPDRPTAIFASNDVMAFGAMEAARVLGLRIPEDVSIVGFDDIPQAASVHPPLTTVRQPLEAMGRVATQMLIAAIESSTQRDERRILPTELLVRSSCQPPAT